jgi:hypothetical protein
LIRSYRVLGIAGALLLPLGAKAEPATSIAVTPSRISGGAHLSPAEPRAAHSAAAQIKITTAHPELVKIAAIDPVQGRPTVKVTPEAATVEVKQGEQLVVRGPTPGPVPVTLAASKKALLSSTVIVGVPDRDSGTTARQLRPFVLAEVTPLRWDETTKRYRTTLLVGLDPTDGDASPDALELRPPIVFQLTGENVDAFQPAQVAVALAGPDGYQRIQVSSRGFSAPIKVSAHSRAGDGSFDTAIDPGPIWFDVGTSDGAIDGLGLGKTTINVRQRAANGDTLLASGPLRVDLKTTAGSLNPPYVDIAPGQASGQTSLVSSAWGAARVSEASSLAGGAHVATINFAFPWLKVWFGVLGAAAAGVVRTLMGKQTKHARRLTFVGCLASGVVVDIFVALGAPIAPDWLLGLIRSELAWFAVGLVAGFPGSAGLEWLASKIFGMPKPQPSQT